MTDEDRAQEARNLIAWLFNHQFTETLDNLVIQVLAHDERERKELEDDSEMLRRGCIVEIAVVNQSVADYIQHWEGRTEIAERDLKAAQEEIAEPEKAR